MNLEKYFIWYFFICLLNHVRKFLNKENPDIVFFFTWFFELYLYIFFVPLLETIKEDGKNDF